MNDTEALVRRLERAAELIALSMSLNGKCDWGCGRFATYEKRAPDGSHHCLGYPPMCDDHARKMWADNRWSEPFESHWQELPQAKRARRFEQLLKNEP